MDVIHVLAVTDLSTVPERAVLVPLVPLFIRMESSSLLLIIAILVSVTRESYNVLLEFAKEQYVISMETHTTMEMYFLDLVVDKTVFVKMDKLYVLMLVYVILSLNQMEVKFLNLMLYLNHLPMFLNLLMLLDNLQSSSLNHLLLSHNHLL
jgi:hypothetical protein